jgi:hypothetical protein
MTLSLNLATHSIAQWATGPKLEHLRAREDGKDVLFYEALSRAIWGTESLCCSLSLKVQQELEEHGDWYRARVGTGFFGCSTDLWPGSCEATCARKQQGITQNDDHSMEAKAG